MNPLVNTLIYLGYFRTYVYAEFEEGQNNWTVTVK